MCSSVSATADCRKDGKIGALSMGVAGGVVTPPPETVKIVVENGVISEGIFSKKLSK